MKAAIIGTRDLKNREGVIRNIFSYVLKNNLDIDFIVSGNAEGTDQIANYFAQKHICVLHYLPWNSYNKHLRQDQNPNIRYTTNVITKFDKHIIQLFPHMKNQKESVWNLIRRNYQIILGEYGDNPVDIVFYHVNTEEVSGGTRYGVLLAEQYNIKTVRV